RRDIGPGLAAVTRDVEWTIVRAGPDHTLLERRFCNRVECAVKLFARYIASDWFTACALAATGMCREIRRDLFPGHTFVTRAVQILRPIIKCLGVVRGSGHWRYSLHPVNEIAGGVAVKR